MSNLWTETASAVPDAVPYDGDGTFDLIVVGGGYTGLSAALYAASAGLSVIVIEAETIGFGGSGRNVGLVNAGLWLPPGDVAKRIGAEAAERLTATLAGGPEAVFQLIDQHKIQCEGLGNGTLHCAHSGAGMKELERRHAQLTATGAPVELLDQDEAQRRVGSKAVHGALFDPRAGTVQPLAYARGLATAARAAGAVILENTRAGDIRNARGVWTVTAGKATLSARMMIDATNAYGMARGRFAPLYYFQMATYPLRPELSDAILPGGEGCWDTALVMSSFRKDAAGRVIVGGIGQLDHRLARIHRAWAHRKLTALFPQVSGVGLPYRWFGAIANTRDHLPKILRLGPGGYAAFGYSGRGIGTGTLFGRALVQALLDEREDELPIAPIDSYDESFSRLRGLWYESGALAAHFYGLLRAG